MPPTIVFAVVVLGALGGVHYYLWKRLVRDVSQRGGWYWRVGTVMAVVMPLTAVTTMLGSELGMPFGARQVVGWPGYYWIACLLYLLLSLLVGEVLRPFALRWLRARAGGAGGDATQRSGARPPLTPTGAPKADPTRDREPVGARAGAASGAALPAGATAMSALADSGADTDAPAAAATAVADPPALTAGRDAKTPDATGDATTTADGGSTPPPGTSEGDAAAAPSDSDSDPESAAAAAAELSRRRFVARGIAVGAAAISVGTVGYGSYAARQLTTKHVTVQLPNLPRAAHGYRIAVASDIHLGPIAGGSHCRRVVDALNATQPDLITVVGDLVDADVDDLRSAAAPLAELSAPDGRFFVTGNHEYFQDPHAWLAYLRELGLVPLENERRELPYFDLAGVNDLEGEGTDHGGPDFEAALGDRDPQRTSVLMAHQPAQVEDAMDYGVDLQLSGHTHGGQMWPITYLAALSNPTLAGLERHGETQLYVTRGAGAWGPPVRVGADPDITVISLASPEA
ncbi:metallophosphoesterase [Streptomyces sp. B6B3]|uniref:metallophosphoesterase n=1 Tax=Streptomyces sp. B6B3 TaxID=3153570 RepID=UPI00325F4C09